MSDAPPGSPYWKLDPSLRETLERSFAARVSRERGGAWILEDGARLPPEDEAALNLANGFWGGSPASVWEALRNAGAEWVSLLVRVHERVRAIDPTLGLWRQIRYVRNGWWGGSGGFKVVYADPAGMRRLLDGLADNARGNKVARDRFFGSLEHQIESPLKVIGRHVLSGPLALLRPDTPPPDAHTWREVDRPGREGLHFCVGLSDTTPALAGTRHVKLDDIHLDWSSPVAGIGHDRRCQYTGVIRSLHHWAQARLHLAKPPFWFHGTGEILRSLCDPARRLPSSAAAERDAFLQEWESVQFDLAVQGTAGLAPAAAYHARAVAIAKRLHPGR